MRYRIKIILATILLFKAESGKDYLIYPSYSKNEILNSTTTFGGGIYSRTVKVYSFI